MKRQHPSARAEIPISQRIYDQLSAASAASHFEKKAWQILEEAIDEWTCRHHPDALAKPANSGYQWKHLFLPDGTLLRTVFNGKNHYCLVDGDAILYEGRAVSPSGFANAVGGIRRNAWKSLWIRFPETSDWKLAETLRTRERPRLERAAPLAAEPVPPPTARAPHAAPATEQPGHGAFAAHEAGPLQREVGGDAREASANVVAPPAGGVQRVGRFRRHKSRIAGTVSERMPDSIQDVVNALRRAEAQWALAFPNQKERPERVFVAWLSSDDGFPSRAS